MHSPPHTHPITSSTTVYVDDNSEEKIEEEAEEITAKTPTATNSAELTPMMFILGINIISFISW
jgi:hypothetical protein